MLTRYRHVDPGYRHLLVAIRGTTVILIVVWVGVQLHLSQPTLTFIGLNSLFAQVNLYQPTPRAKCAYLIKVQCLMGLSASIGLYVHLPSPFNQLLLLSVIFAGVTAARVSEKWHFHPMIACAMMLVGDGLHYATNTTDPLWVYLGMLCFAMLTNLSLHFLWLPEKHNAGIHHCLSSLLACWVETLSVLQHHPQQRYRFYLKSHQQLRQLIAFRKKLMMDERLKTDIDPIIALSVAITDSLPLVAIMQNTDHCGVLTKALQALGATLHATASVSDNTIHPPAQFNDSKDILLATLARVQHHILQLRQHSWQII